jgi:hypothetical protein
MNVSEVSPNRRRLGGVPVWIAAGAFLACMGQQARAVPVTEDFSVSLGSFIDIVGSTPSPIASFSAVFEVTFDPAVSETGDTANIQVLNQSNLPSLGSALGFNYHAVARQMSIGGIQNGAGNIAGLTNDFVVQLDLTNLNAPRLNVCSDPGFSCGSAPGSTLASGFTVSSSTQVWLATVAAVPEPASIALLGFGLAAAAGLRRRRR